MKLSSIIKAIALTLITIISLWAEGSREGDSLALVAIKKMNPESSINWDYSQPITTWNGVTINSGRVDSLNLKNCGLTLIPSDIGTLANLSFLDLYNNNLTSIPIGIGNLTNLKSLDLGSTSITTISSELWDLTNLEALWLDKNAITSIPVEIANLIHLKRLSFSNNKLKTIPSEIGNLTNLRSLSLYNNSLRRIPTEIGNLSNLESLSLALNSLSCLDIEYCKSTLHTLPSDWGNLPPHYSPQRDLTTIVSADSTFLFVSIDGSDNYYQWFKNDVELTGAISDTLYIRKDSLATVQYNCKVRSNVITDLTLWTTTTLTPEEDFTTPIHYDPQATTVSSEIVASFQNSSITLSLPQTQSVDITLYDLRGRSIMAPITQILSAGVHSFAVTDEIAQGFYILNITGTVQELSQKVLIQ